MKIDEDQAGGIGLAAMLIVGTLIMLILRVTDGSMAMAKPGHDREVTVLPAHVVMGPASLEPQKIELGCSPRGDQVVIDLTSNAAVPSRVLVEIDGEKKVSRGIDLDAWGLAVVTVYAPGARTCRLVAAVKVA